MRLYETLQTPPYCNIMENSLQQYIENGVKQKSSTN